jgi:hypothetical protein
MALLNFKASSIELSERDPRSFGPLPAGNYEMMIVRSDTKPTKRGDGHYLELEMHVLSGDHCGRRHWERLNLDSPSLQAVKIAQEHLARLCVALGMDEVGDSDELHDKPFYAELGIDKKDDQRNVIWGYAPVNDAPLLAQPPAPAPRPAAPAPAAPAAPKRPWG